MSKKGTTQNIERPQSAQELRLLETQNAMQQQAIGIAQQQEDRSNEQNKIWKENYLPMEVSMNGDPRGGQKEMDMLNNQMPRYAEDTSGAMDQKAPQRQAKGAGSNGKGA